MFNRLKFVALLLPILSVMAWGQTAPGDADVSAGDQSATTAAVTADAPETSPTTVPGMTLQYDDAHVLKISARRTRLGDLLAAIGEKTGVSFDLPDSLADRLITAEAGPAPLRDALTALLKKLEVGYGISGDPAQPGIVERVVLTEVSEAGGTPGGDHANADVAKSPEEQSDDGMTPFEVEEMLALKAVDQNRLIEKNLAEAEAERQAQIAKEDFGGKPPEPGKTAAPPRKHAKKNPATPQPD